MSNKRVYQLRRNQHQIISLFSMKIFEVRNKSFKQAIDESRGPLVMREILLSSEPSDV